LERTIIEVWQRKEKITWDPLRHFSLGILGDIFGL